MCPRMHDVCVRTVQIYGAAVCASGPFFSTPQTVVNSGMEQLHVQFVRTHTS